MRIPDAQTRQAAAALGVVLLAVACAGSRDDPSARTVPVTVRTHLTQDPASLSMLGKTDRNGEVVAGQITDSLVQYRPDMSFAPRVAESWEFSEDRLTLTLRLRPGVRWHDGRDVTADDVVFTVNQARDPAVESRAWAPLFQDVVDVEAPDERTVVARYSVATPDALEAWRVPLLPRHLAESGADLISGRFASHPVGCGPFRFVRQRLGEEIVLEANEDYWDGRPEIDRLVFRIYPDQRTGYEAVIKGDLDIMTLTPDLWAEAQRSPRAAGLASFVYPRLALWRITWNLDDRHRLFDDAGVRRALILGLDRAKFIERLLHGAARPAITSYHPDLPWSDPDLEPLGYDPDEALGLLARAGFEDSDGDGTLDRNGAPFSFTLLIGASVQPVNDHLAAWLQQSWKDLGIEVEIEKLEWRQYLTRMRDHDFDASMGGLSLTPNPDHYELYHSSAAEHGYNYGSFSDPEVDRLLTRGRTTFDVDERTRTYRALERRLRDLQPLGFLIHFDSPVIHDPRLEGLVASPIGMWNTTVGPRTWRWAGERED